MKAETKEREGIQRAPYPDAAAPNVGSEDVDTAVRSMTPADPMLSFATAPVTDDLAKHRSETERERQVIRPTVAGNHNGERPKSRMTRRINYFNPNWKQSTFKQEVTEKDGGNGKKDQEEMERTQERNAYTAVAIARQVSIPLPRKVGTTYPEAVAPNVGSADMDTPVRSMEPNDPMPALVGTLAADFH